MIYVAIGGFFGAIARFLVGGRITNCTSSTFPVGTLFINVVGSFLLGICFSLNPLESVVLLCAIGFLGAFTTFSTFCYEIVKLWHDKKRTVALVYVALSFIIGISAAVLGFQLN